MRWLVVVVCCCVARIGSADRGLVVRRTEAAHERVALVIGNANYSGAGALRNPVNDARRVKETLDALGFQVELKTDVTQKELIEAINAFGQRVQGKDALFFYAGHAVQVRNKNYLIPVDATVSSDDELKYKSYELEDVLARMTGRTNIVIVDACRNNPFARAMRGGGRGGLAATNAATGMLIAFATKPDEVADDGSGENSPFTTALVEHMPTRGLELIDMLRRVRTDVVANTNGQYPVWDDRLTEGHFYFAPLDGPEPAIPVRVGTRIEPVTAAPAIARMEFGAEVLLATLEPDFLQGQVGVRARLREHASGRHWLAVGVGAAMFNDLDDNGVDQGTDLGFAVEVLQTYRVPLGSLSELGPTGKAIDLGLGPYVAVATTSGTPLAYEVGGMARADIHVGYVTGGLWAVAAPRPGSEFPVTVGFALGVRFETNSRPR